MTADVHRSASAQLARHEARYTRQRRELVELLIEAGQPLTVEELQGLAPHLAQSSLYRNLAVLEEADIVRRFISQSGFARYELAEALTGHHHHLVCSSCGAMTDVQLPRTVEDQLVGTFVKLARKQRFDPSSHTIDILGRCDDCTQRGRR